MPHTHYTDQASEPVLANSWLGAGSLVKLNHARDRPLQLLVFNEEFLYSKCKSSACVDYVPALCIHTAHCYYRLNGLVKSLDWSVKYWIEVASDCLTFTLNY